MEGDELVEKGRIGKELTRTVSVCLAGTVCTQHCHGVKGVLLPQLGRRIFLPSSPGPLHICYLSVALHRHLPWAVRGSAEPWPFPLLHHNYQTWSMSNFPWHRNFLPFFDDDAVRQLARRLATAKEFASPPPTPRALCPQRPRTGLFLHPPRIPSF